MDRTELEYDKLRGKVVSIEDKLKEILKAQEDIKQILYQLDNKVSKL